MNNYMQLFRDMAEDFDITLEYLIKLYRKNNISLILKQCGIPIGILIMDDIYYEKINEFVHFIKYIWISKQYRRKHYGSKTISNIKNLKHIMTNCLASIVLNVEKDNDVIHFYNRLGFTKIDDNDVYDVLLLQVDIICNMLTGVFS